MNTPIAWARSMAAVGCAGCLGDMSCQILEKGEVRLDPKRTCEFVIVSTLIMGPANHGFELCAEKAFPGTAARQVVSKVLTRVVAAPAILSLNFGSLALIQQRDYIEAIHKNLLPAWIMGSSFWPMAAAFTYRVIPITARPAFTSVLGAFWQTYLSFMAHNRSQHHAKTLHTMTANASPMIATTATTHQISAKGDL